MSTFVSIRVTAEVKTSREAIELVPRPQMDGSESQQRFSRLALGLESFASIALQQLHLLPPDKGLLHLTDGHTCRSEHSGTRLHSNRKHVLTSFCEGTGTCAMKLTPPSSSSCSYLLPSSSG